VKKEKTDARGVVMGEYKRYRKMEKAYQQDGTILMKTMILAHFEFIYHLEMLVHLGYQIQRFSIL
jgi:hypothetical protein